MRIFESNSKINFIDELNNLVGYDMGQSCCEYADWFIHASPDALSDRAAEAEAEARPPLGDLNRGLEPYVFDVERGFTEAGEHAVFRLVADGQPDQYLHIFNHHNGYYGHGLEWCRDGVVIRSTVL